MRAAVNDAVAGKLKTRGGGAAGRRSINSVARPQARGEPHALGDRQEGADRALSGAVCADRSVGERTAATPQAMQKAEIASFARLMVTDTSHNLVRVFFLREKLKRPDRRTNGPASACT